MFPSTLPTLAGGLLLFGAATAQAATLLVTTTADSYDGVCNLHCSLRDAVAMSNSSPNLDTILLPPGTFTLSRPAPLDAGGEPIDDDDHQLGDLDVTGELRIRGVDTAKSRVKGQFNDRLFEVRAGAHLRLQKLTLENGNTVHNGGAVENHGTMLLREVLVQNNRADTLNPYAQDLTQGQGGAIANYNELIVVASQFLDNRANLARNGQGRGGAIFNRGNLRVRDSNFVRNWVDGSNDTGSGGALYNGGSAVVERSSITDGQTAEMGLGGGIMNEGGELDLINSTLSSNTSAALFNGFRYGPIERPSKATLTSVTITDNQYGVINVDMLFIRNSLIVGNYDEFGEQPANCDNRSNAAIYQAIGLLRNDEPSNCSADLFVPIEQTFTQVLSPELIPHGRTKTHDLIPGSPAIDAGIGDCIAYDQRGVARPQDGNGDGVAVCDLGAYELIP